MSDTVYLGNPNLKKANVKVEFTPENLCSKQEHLVASI